MNQSKYEWYLLSFLVVIVATVLWQVFGAMTQAGMASGGPLDNAAAYPKVLAILLATFVAVRALTRLIQSDRVRDKQTTRANFNVVRNSTLLLFLFGCYLVGLNTLGYHLVTPPFLFASLYLAGERKVVSITSFAVLSSLSVAFLFEVPLRIVLPGGVFGLNIPW